MVDFVLGLALAGMLIRGWMRGFVREILDLVGLVVGIWIAFRLSRPLGDFLTDSFGVSPELGRIGSGVVLFILFGIGLGIAAHYLSKLMSLPGLTLVNRVGGAAVATAWGVAIVFVVVSLVSLLPIPGGWRDRLDQSAVVQAIAGDDSVPRSVFESLAGDNTMSALGSLQGIFGSSRAVPEGREVISFPAARADEIRQVRDEAEDLVRRINELRVGQGLDAVGSVDVVTRLAEKHAAASYRAGELARLADCAVDLAEVGYQVVTCGNAAALAGSSLAALDGILETEGGRESILEPSADRAGVAVVEGPTGRLVVVIVAG